MPSINETKLDAFRDFELLITLNPKDKFDPFPTSIAIKGVQSELDDKENSKAKLHSTFSGTLIIINELDHIPASILDLISIVSFLLVFLGTKISKALLICDNMTRDISFF